MSVYGRMAKPGSAVLRRQTSPVPPAASRAGILQCLSVGRRLDMHMWPRYEHCLPVQEDIVVFRAAMAKIGALLTAAASAVLTPAAVTSSAVNGPSEDYAQALCEAMTAYGCLHLDCLASGVEQGTFLQQAGLSS